MKDIPGFEGRYAASEEGKIWSHLRNKWLALCISPGTRGYLVCCLGTKSLRVHQLIARTFIGKPEKGYEINHKNGIKTDNRLENLEICSHADNVKHALRTVVKKSNKLNRETVKEIRYLFQSGIPKQDIADAYGVKIRQVYKVGSGEQWGWLV